MAKKVMYEVIIIGGSVSGLSAAMTLGRSLRKTLVIDSGNPCNKKTPYSHNLLTLDGLSPKKILSTAKKQVLEYPSVTFSQDLVVEIKKYKNHFKIRTSNKELTSQYVILATGLKDELPSIKGFEACWGKSVIHCPYCHGYENKGKITGILANEDAAFHYAKILKNFTKNLVIFTNGKAKLTSDQKKWLKKNAIDVIDKQIQNIHHKNGKIESLEFKNGSNFPLDVLYASVSTSQQSDFAEKLGCEITDAGLVFVETSQQTCVPNVFACGDNSSPIRTLAHEISSGNAAGINVNNELSEHDF